MRIFPSYNTQAYYVNSRAYDTFSDIGNALGNASYQFQKSVGIIPDPQTHLNPQVVPTSHVNAKTGNVAQSGETDQFGGKTLFNTLPSGNGDPSGANDKGWCYNIGLPSNICDFVNSPSCEKLGLPADLCQYWPYILGFMGLITVWMIFKK